MDGLGDGGGGDDGGGGGKTFDTHLLHSSHLT
jgi:hypothetical protein